MIGSLTVTHVRTRDSPALERCEGEPCIAFEEACQIYIQCPRWTHSRATMEFGGSVDGVHFDSETQWPIAVLTFRGHYEEGAFFSVLDRIQWVIDAQTRFAFIVDAGDAMVHANAIGHMKAVATCWQDNEADLRRYCVGTAFVLRKPMMRGVLRALFKLRAFPAESCVVEELPMATAWVQERLGLGGGELLA